MSLNSTRLHQLLEGYEWFMRENRQTVNVEVDMSHIEEAHQIVVVKVNGEWVAIGADARTTEKEVFEEVKRHDEE